MPIDESALYSYIGKQLRQRRRALKQTQQWLADWLELERTSVSNIEAGMQRVPLHVLYRCCELLDLEITDLVPSKESVIETSPDHRGSQMRFDGRTVHVPPKAASLVQQIRGELGEER